jgi:HSP20 family protein
MGGNVMLTNRGSCGEPVETADVHYHISKSNQQFFLVRHSQAWHPPTDVLVENNRLIVVVEIAGMRSGDFHVTFANQHLTISGLRSAKEHGHAAYHQLEVRYGEFRTDVILPWPVDAEKIIAHYEDGFLQVELSRAKPYTVHIVEADQSL